MSSQKSLFRFTLLSIFIHVGLFCPQLVIYQGNLQIIKFSENISPQKASRLNIVLRDIKTETTRKPKRSQKVVSQRNSKTKLNKKEEFFDRGRKDVLAKYLDKVQSIIQENNSYPNIAKKLRMEGKVKLAFEIEQPNKIKNVKFIKKTDFLILNNYAFKLIQNLSLPSIPNQLQVKLVKVTVPITYELL